MALLERAFPQLERPKGRTQSRWWRFSRVQLARTTLPYVKGNSARPGCGLAKTVDSPQPLEGGLDLRQRERRWVERPAQPLEVAEDHMELVQAKAAGH